jgi:hypothetical protein
MENYFSGPEKREYVRLEYSKPLAYKVCKQETLTKIFEGYTVNVSQIGLLCNLKDKVNVDDILWLSFDRNILIICKEVEKNSMIYQNGVIGKVVRVNNDPNGSFDVGVKFLTREEKELPDVKTSINFLEHHENK